MVSYTTDSEDVDVPEIVEDPTSQTIEDELFMFLSVPSTIPDAVDVKYDDDGGDETKDGGDETNEDDEDDDDEDVLTNYNDNKRLISVVVTSAFIISTVVVLIPHTISWMYVYLTCGQYDCL